jgi:hypothetical protein
MATGRPQPAVPASVRRALAARSGGWCEMRLAGCLGRATDPAHRIASGNGGRHGAAKVHHDRLSNVLYGCRGCHRWTHEHVAEAEALGLMLRDGDVSEGKRVLLPAHGWVLLDNDGGFGPEGTVLDAWVCCRWFNPSCALLPRRHRPFDACWSPERPR